MRHFNLRQRQRWIPACAGMTGQRKRLTKTKAVTPATAGVQSRHFKLRQHQRWIPAFAGMTTWGEAERLTIRHPGEGRGPVATDAQRTTVNSGSRIARRVTASTSTPLGPALVRDDQWRGMKGAKAKRIAPDRQELADYAALIRPTGYGLESNARLPYTSRMKKNIARTSFLLAGAGTALYVASPFLDFDEKSSPESPLTVSIVTTATGDTGEVLSSDTMLDQTIDVVQVENVRMIRRG